MRVPPLLSWPPPSKATPCAAAGTTAVARPAPSLTAGQAWPGRDGGSAPGRRARPRSLRPETPGSQAHGTRVAGGAVGRGSRGAGLREAVPLAGGALGQGIRGEAAGPASDGRGHWGVATRLGGGVCAGRGLHKVARPAGSLSLSAPSMVLGAPASRALLLLPPLLPLPQVGRRRSARAPRGGSALGAPRPGLTPVPTGGAGLRGRQLRPLGPVSQGGGSPGLAPPCGGGSGGTVGPAGAPPAPGVAVPAGARPRPAGAACGTWGKWRPRRSPPTLLAPRMRSRQPCPLPGADGRVLGPSAASQADPCLQPSAPGRPLLWALPQSGTVRAPRPLAGLPFIARLPTSHPLLPRPCRRPL